MFRKRLLLVFAAAATVVLAGCELFGIGSYTISGTIIAHTYVPADSVRVVVDQWSGPHMFSLRPQMSTVLCMPEPDTTGYSKGFYTVKFVYPNLDGMASLLITLRSSTAPIGAFCRINGGQAKSISGIPWRAEDQYCDYYIYYGTVTEPKDFTIDIDLGS